MPVFKTFPQTHFSNIENENSSNDLEFFISFLSTLETAKKKCKNLHWAAKNIEVTDKRGSHLYLDDFLDVIASTQDTIAEISQGILGSMQPNDITQTEMEVNTPLELVMQLIDSTKNFYTKIPSDVSFVGIKAEIETFIGSLFKYKYLFELAA